MKSSHILNVYFYLEMSVSPAIGTPDTCLSSITGWSYTGQQNTTINGYQCQRWDQQSPHPHKVTVDMLPDTSLFDAANYCRSPNLDTTGPWCYTTHSSVLFDYCYIPKCRDGKHLTPSAFQLTVYFTYFCNLFLTTTL